LPICPLRRVENAVAGGLDLGAHSEYARTIRSRLGLAALAAAAVFLVGFSAVVARGAPTLRVGLVLAMCASLCHPSIAAE
jgi:hypothetical protein